MTPEHRQQVVGALRAAETFIMGALPHYAKDRSEAVDSTLPTIRAALAVMEAEEEQGWMPIESAPQNGTDVLVCFNSGRGAILIARTPGTGQWWTGGLTRIQTPTHWQSLPAPPEVKQGSAT